MKPARLSPASAAVSGVLAVAAALGAGHIVAGLTLVADASPFLAVGNAAIDRTPAPIKDFAIDKFGTADKPALLIGMAVVLTGAGALIGLISRRSAWPGLLAIAGLGIVGILAVREQTSLPLGLLAPVASMLTGLVVFWWLRRWSPSRPGEPDDAEQTGQRPGQRLARRRFLLGSAGVAAGAAVATVTGSALQRRIDVDASRMAVGALIPAIPAPPIPAGAAFPELGTPTFLTPSQDFYRIDINLTVPALRAEDAVLKITGLVDRELSIPYSEIRRMPLVEKTITMTCVSNEVGGPYVSTSNFIGVPLIDLLDRAGIRAEATQVVGRSADGFTIGTPLQLLRDAGDEALLAIGMNREPLLPEHGFPMRTVVPGLYGYVSATKWLTELELATYDVKPYWVKRGWDGAPPGVVPIKISSRVDSPAPFQQLPAGEVTVAGTAWAQGRGLERVEVRFDDGEWEDAELATEVNKYTWRMFRLTRPLQPGLHKVTVRATDGTGVTQPQERLRLINPGPTPDGSTGWHAIDFSVD